MMKYITFPFNSITWDVFFILLWLNYGFHSHIPPSTSILLSSFCTLFVNV